MWRLPTLVHVPAFATHDPEGRTNPELNAGNITARRTFVNTDAMTFMLINCVKKIKSQSTVIEIRLAVVEAARASRPSGHRGIVGE